MAASFQLSKAYVEIGVKGPLKEQLAAASAQAKGLADGLQKQIDKVGGAAASMFARGTAAITGFVAAASPDAINTLTLSMKLLAGEIGASFLPYAAKAAYAIQSLRNYIRDMDPALKATLAQWAIWGVAVAGFVAILPGLVTRLQLLYEAIMLVGRGILFLAANPAVAALMAVGAAAAYATYKLKQGNDTLQQNLDLSQKVADNSQSRKQVMMNPEVLKVMQMSPDQRGAATQKRIDSLDAENSLLEKRQKDLAGRGSIEKFVESMPGGSTANLKGDIEKNQKNLAALRIYQKSQQTGMPVPENGGLGGFKLQTSMSMQPQRLGVEDLGKAFQMAALQDPLQGEKASQEERNNAVFQRAAETVIINADRWAGGMRK